ncbi:hypothetical protein NDN13_03265 [Acinetobacter sp. C32I]|uniref:hypothetical protein n=1 Tax=Acinetobacter sp. C32I TaxID=2950074 RepID=UPI0020375546|nr:hypothetical protein [Acinetobacter sp. C32I]USA54229.1 hypothetical protein NDN13_03265 [Acinetobacter sp. C32I]
MNALILLFMSNQIHAAVTCGTSASTLPNLNSVYKSGEFRIFYSSNPANADYIPDQSDANNNSIPDYVENVAIQATTTTEALTSLGFTHPLNSDRYTGAAKFIDIHLTALTGNGVAYENPSIFINKPTKEGKCALNLYIRNNIEEFPGNYWTTVTHEIFHLYQYGYNQFKGGWYLEGMTNWAERVLRLGTQGGNGLTPLPDGQEQLIAEVYEVPYNQLWHRLAVLSDTTNGQLNLPPNLVNRTYIDGTKVFKDDKLKGYLFIKKTLENLKIKSDQISSQNGWNPHNWDETDQSNPANRTFMLKAIQDSMLQFGMNQTQEEKDFLLLK